MRSLGKYVPVFSAVVLLTAAAAEAARVDMNDPRRAVGREDDIRVDAQITKDVLSNSSPIAVTYQIENLTRGWIAVADKACTTDYDRDSQTITLSVGAEVPKDGDLPHMVTIAPGAKKTFSVGAMAHVAVTGSRSPFASYPRFVQVKVNVLRDVTPFQELIAKQEAAGAVAQIRLSDAQFDAWMQANDSIFLNSIPVGWKSGGSSTIDAEQSSSRTGQMSTFGGNW